MVMAQRPPKGAKFWRCSFIGVFIIAVLIAVALIIEYKQYEKLVENESKSRLQQLTQRAANDIDDILKSAMADAEKLAEKVGALAWRDEALRSSLKFMLENNHYIYGGSITFKPYAFNEKRRLYSAYYSKNGDGRALKFQYLEEIYDYTEPAYDWYVEPMRLGSRWSEPYWDEAGKTYMITYSALFYDSRNASASDPVPAGMVTVDISLAEIRNVIESLNIGSNGFGALTTKDGNYLYHPNYEYVLQHKNIRDIAYEKDDSDRLLLADAAQQQARGIVDHVSTTTGMRSWLIYEPVTTSGWSLQNTFIRDGSDVDVNYLRHQLVWILVAFVVVLLSLLALVFRVELASSKRLWLFSSASALVLAVGVYATWYLALEYHTPIDGKSIKVTDKNTLQTLMVEYTNRLSEKSLASPIYVPTGVQIDTFKFSGASEIVVGGYVWQKYPSNVSPDIKKGFQVAHATSLRVTEIDRQSKDGSEIIRWRFQANVRVQMDYSRYPLEVERIGLHLVPVETVANVLFVPDLDAYKLLTTTLLPGMDESIFVPGWRLTDAMFSFKAVNPMTDFGVERNFDQDVFPELHYEIGLKRIFVDAFISNLTPLIVVLIALFALNLMPGKIDVGRVLSVCVAVFFVVVFSHLDIRKNIATGEIFYLEYFFFIVYLTIILVPFNTIRITMETPSVLFDYKDSIVPKTIYWPSIMFLFFVITVVKFY